MSKRAAIPLLASACGGLVLLASGPSRKSVDASAATPHPASPLPHPEGAYFSHDWYEPPPRETRQSLLPSAGQNPTVTCTLPNCRNCQIHATWKQSL